jgi:hypothetical protein
MRGIGHPIITLKGYPLISALIAEVYTMTLIGDSESDGFKYEATRLWMVVTYNVESKGWIISLDQPISDYDMEGICLITGVSSPQVFIGHEEHLMIMKQHKLVFHNGIMHDFPLIRKLYPWWKEGEKDDTFIMSSLFNPDREAPTGSKKPHSIEAWGIRFGQRKVVYDQWDRQTALMLIRCIEDVKIGHRTYDHLRIESKGWDWSRSLQLEYMMGKIQAQQEMNGVTFDVDKAHTILSQIDEEVATIDTVVLEQIPRRVVSVGAEVSKPFKKNGTYTKQVEDWMHECEGPIH